MKWGWTHKRILSHNKCSGMCRSGNPEGGSFEEVNHGLHDKTKILRIIKRGRGKTKPDH